MKYSSKVTENVIARARVNSLSQPISASCDDVVTSKDRASLMLLLDLGASVRAIDAAVSQAVFADMFGTKETVAEARVSHGFISGPEAIPATMTLASLAQMEAPVPAPENKLDSAEEAMAPANPIPL